VVTDVSEERIAFIFRVEVCQGGAVWDKYRVFQNYSDKFQGSWCDPNEARKEKCTYAETATVRDTRVIGSPLTCFNPEDGRDTFLRNVGNHLEDNMALQLRRL
jgi:hypothetical protein